MRTLISIFMFLAFSAAAFADVETDKAIARISRDGENYLSEEVRAASEQEATAQALSGLRGKVSNFLISIGSDMSLNDASRMFETIVSKVSDKRYRVLAYVSKEALGGAGYVEPQKVPEPAPSYQSYDDDDRDYIEEPHPYGNNSSSTLAEIRRQGTFNELRNCLETLRKSNAITGAAAFPVAHADDFYLVIVDDNIVKKIIHVVRGRYLDSETNQEIDMTRYARCTGYWFTLP